LTDGLGPCLALHAANPIELHVQSVPSKSGRHLFQMLSVREYAAVAARSTAYENACGKDRHPWRPVFVLGHCMVRTKRGAAREGSFQGDAYPATKCACRAAMESGDGDCLRVTAETVGQIPTRAPGGPPHPVSCQGSDGTRNSRWASRSAIWRDGRGKGGASGRGLPPRANCLPLARACAWAVWARGRPEEAKWRQSSVAGLRRKGSKP
jgi:hypothetical protein